MNPIESNAARAASQDGAHPSKGALFNAIDRLCDIDYMADANNVGPSGEAQTAIELLHKVRPIEERLDLAWVGAAVAQMFLRHVWLQSVHLEVSAENHHDDHGGSFVSHSLQFNHAVAVPNVRLPDDLADDDGAFNEDAAAELLGSEHEDDAYDFAAPFLLPSVVDATTLQLDREALSTLLTRSGPVSGLEVARTMWPDHEVMRQLAAQASA